MEVGGRVVSVAVALLAENLEMLNIFTGQIFSENARKCKKVNILFLFVIYIHERVRGLLKKSYNFSKTFFTCT